jgi:aryl-alcohol dehydrogenase-like predicted oxidoreductase
MKYRKLGRTGFEVSEMAQGLWGMSGWAGSDDAESLAAMQAAIDAGCNFFDTAWAYGDGHSDELLGKIIAKNKGKRIYAASKIPPKDGNWPPKPGAKYQDVFPTEYVFEYARKIREKLGTDSIDVLQLHVWEDRWADDKHFLELPKRLRSEGLIRFFGISINRWEPENGIAAIETGLIDTVQVIYNIFDQSPEDRLFPICREHNIGVIARVPLDEGSLGGKMTLATKFDASDWRAKYFGPDNLAPTIERVEKLKKIVPAGMTLPEMALRFILADKDVSTVIAGMRKLAHVRENMATSDAPPLDSALMSALRAHRWDRKPSHWSD